MPRPHTLQRQLTLKQLDAARGDTKLRELEVRAREREESLHVEKMKALRDSEGAAAQFIKDLKAQVEDLKAQVRNLECSKNDSLF